MTFILRTDVRPYRLGEYTTAGSGTVDRFLLTVVRLPPLIPAEEVAGIDFVLNVVEDGVVAVGNDGLGALLEVFQVVYHTTAEEGGAILEGGFVDNNFCALGLDALHDALNGTLTEVVGVGLHGEAEDADGGWFV